MRESIGTVSLLNFIIFFILLIFAFLMGTFSYYKAYRVNNAIVSAIEKYEGFNKYSQEEIRNKFITLGYTADNFNCPKKRGDGNLIDSNGADFDGDPKERGYAGYCVYAHNSDSVEQKNTDVYDSYEVVTIITFQFPIVQDLLKLKVSARTGLIYNFEESLSNMG